MIRWLVVASALAGAGALIPEAAATCFPICTEESGRVIRSLACCAGGPDSATEDACVRAMKNGPGPARHVVVVPCPPDGGVPNS